MITAAMPLTADGNAYYGTCTVHPPPPLLLHKPWHNFITLLTYGCRLSPLHACYLWISSQESRDEYARISPLLMMYFLIMYFIRSYAQLNIVWIEWEHINKIYAENTMMDKKLGSKYLYIFGNKELNGSLLLSLSVLLFSVCVPLWKIMPAKEKHKKHIKSIRQLSFKKNSSGSRLLRFYVDLLLIQLTYQCQRSLKTCGVKMCRECALNGFSCRREELLLTYYLAYTL
jgi:hypothetical protein